MNFNFNCKILIWVNRSNSRLILCVWVDSWLCLKGEWIDVLFRISVYFRSLLTVICWRWEEANLGHKPSRNLPEVRRLMLGRLLNISSHYVIGWYGNERKSATRHQDGKKTSRNLLMELLVLSKSCFNLLALLLEFHQVDRKRQRIKYS